MAANEQDREDLIREASGLLPRAEISASQFPENIIFGFKRQGGLSIYFGADPVYQFNSVGELRRCHIDGDLLKAEAGRLVVLRRDRTEQEVVLWSTELAAAETAKVLGALEGRLVQLRNVLESGDWRLVAEVPKGAESISRLRDFLRAIAAPPLIAQRANAT